jgi:hypothetical protein
MFAAVHRTLDKLTRDFLRPVHYAKSRALRIESNLKL